jgi:TonB family protein
MQPLNAARERIERPLALLGMILIFFGTRAPASEKDYLMTYQEADPRFLSSIERVAPCKIRSDPVPMLRFAEQLYPRESIARHEEGTVQMEFIFDSDWCIRKATIVKSTGYWRLDQVSLSYVMTVRYKPSKGLKMKDGEPTVVVQLGWGASQGRH